MPNVPVVRSLSDRVAEIFTDSGSLARSLATFESRPAQRNMAEAVAETIDHGGVLLVEAGTGTGKTLAYLVPAILSGQRVLVSTGKLLHSGDMATLPGMPQDDDDPEPDALPFEPDDGLPPPIVPQDPGHEPVEPPRA